MLTQAELKRQLHYDPDTGIFTWIARKYGKNRIGTEAGTRNKLGYVYIWVNNQHHCAHRLAWIYMHGQCDSQMQIDHINQVKHDNRISNLRLVTNQQNLFNTSKKQNNKSGWLGVHYSLSKRKYVAAIKVNYKRIYLGSFDTAEKAGQAYLSAKSELHVI